MPYDGGTTYQPGARLAPYHLRRVSALVQSYHPVHRTDVFARLNVRDGGNVVFPPFDSASVRAAVQAEVARVVDAGAVPFVVGGDHSVALPAMRAVAAAHGPLAVVHFDAHLDTSTAEVWGDPWHHGTPLRHAISEGLIAPGLAGADRRARRLGLGRRRSAGRAVRRRSRSAPTPSPSAASPSVAEEIREVVGDLPVYVTFDIDGIDPAFAPGTGTPVPGGLTAREALGLVRGLFGARLVGMDLVEVAPALDVSDITSHLGGAPPLRRARAPRASMRNPLTSDLGRTVEDLAAFGEKRAGTDAGARAAEYLLERFRRAGLQDVEAQPFAFPGHDRRARRVRARHRRRAHARRLRRARSLRRRPRRRRDRARRLGHAPRAHPRRARRPHRARRAQPALSPLDAIQRLRRRRRRRRDLRLRRAVEPAPGRQRAPRLGGARPHPGDHHRLAPTPTPSAPRSTPTRSRALALAVDVGVARAVGRNIVGRVRGLGDGELVVGAHFDTWFAGSTDNGGGVAAMLALAERRALRPPARYGITFVAWDGEELALYGGYHHLRRYALDGTRPLAVIDFETPSAIGAQAYGLARSNHAPIDDAIIGVGLHELFALNVPMDLVAELFGGVIPTDIQGLYRAGTPAVATAVDAPWYHTTEDTPDKVDLPRLEVTVNAFDRAIDRLMTAPADRFAARDAALWQAAVTTGRRGADLVVDVAVKDAAGRAQAGAFVEAVLFDDDFFARATVLGRTDGDGCASLHLRGCADGEGPRFLHIASGTRWPLVEVVRPL